MNGYDAQDMASQGADGFRNGYQAGYADAVKAIEAAKPAAAQEAVGVDAYDDALDQLWKLAGGNDHPVYKRFLDFRDSFAAPVTAAPYSIDADPLGIRATVADCITGALMVGAQGHTKPPEGHWLLPFWEMARADAQASTPAAPGIDLAEVPRYVLSHTDDVSEMRESERGAWVRLRDVEDVLAAASPKGDAEPIGYAKPQDLVNDGYGNVIRVYQSSVPMDATVPVYASPKGGSDWEATDADIAAWQQRHDLIGAFGSRTDARAAFEDARSAEHAAGDAEVQP